MKAVLIALVLGYAAYAALMVWMHPRFIYPFQPDDRVLEGFSRVQFAATDGTPIYLQELNSDGPVVLYFMGNAGALSLFDVAFDKHRLAGRHVIALEFRGGAGRPGTPNEARLKSDALQAADYALALGKPVIIQGFSLGTGLATYVAARRNVAGVMLTAPYDRLCRLMAASARLPACLLPVQRWNSLAEAKANTKPTLVLHGSEDTLIAPAYSEGFAALPQVRRVLIEGAAHNNISSFPASDNEIEGFIASLTD